MKRFGTADSSRLVSQQRQRWDSEREAEATAVQSAIDAEDRRYSAGVNFRQRLMIRFFRKQVEAFSKAALAAASDRGVIDLRQAHAIARTVENRLRPVDG